MKPKPHWDEHRFEQFLGNLLRSGVMLSALIVALGGALYLIRHGTELPNYHLFRGEPKEFRVLPSILENGLTLRRRRSLIQIGLLILIATPVLRVVCSAYGFVRQGDRPYVVITLIVLIVLLHSLLAS
ncbi:MAG TPA: DUF1634 domain-containing protein [Chroococcidiopsis sp.]